MADVTHNLMIKYGLSRQPTQTESDSWLREVERLVAQGVSKDDAGRQAAQAILPGYRTRVYASEGDTIETLLSKAKEK